MSNNIKTWADGYGRWHVEVPSGENEHYKAVSAIACEIWDRNRDFTTIDEVIQYVESSIVNAPSETPGQVHFIEYEVA